MTTDVSDDHWVKNWT